MTEPKIVNKVYCLTSGCSLINGNDSINYLSTEGDPLSLELNFPLGIFY